MSLKRALMCVFLAVCAGRAADVRIIEQIIAKVNGEVITQSEINRFLKAAEAELRQQGLTGERLQQALKAREADILRDRIDNLLLVQRAKELDLKVDSEVTKQLAELQRRAKIADQEKFQDFVREQSGLSYEDFRQQLTDDFLRRRVISQEIGSKIHIPRAEIEKYYKEHQDEFIRDERVFLSEILISTVGKSPEEIPALEKKARSLVERARRGERFPELARDNSDSESAEDGGELGAFSRRDLQPQIADIVFAQQRGYVTDPIRVPNGFLILRVDEKHNAGLASLEEVENEIFQKLADPKFQPAVREYLTKLRMNAFLEIREGYVDSGAAPGKDTSWMRAAELKPETVTKEEVVSRRYRPRLFWLIPMPWVRTAGTVNESP